MGNSIIIEAELISGSEQVLEIGLDSAVLEKGLTNIADLLKNLQVTTVRVAAVITSAFTVGFQKVGTQISSLETTIDGVTRSIENLQTSLNDGVDVGGVIDGIMSIGASIATIFTSGNIGSKIFEVLSTCFTNLRTVVSTALGAIAAATGLPVGAVVAIVAAVIAAITAIVVFWDEISVFFTDTLPAALSQAVQWIGEIFAPLAEKVGGVVSAIGAWISSAWEGIQGILSAVAQWIMDNVIQPIMDFFTSMGQWLAQLFGSIGQTFSDIFYNIGVIVSGCWQVIKKIWEGVSSWFQQYVIQPVAGFFAGLWNGIVNAAKQVWAGIQSVFSTVASFFGNIFSNAWAAVVKVFSAAGTIFENIKDGVLSVFKTIVNGLIDGINAVVSVPFKGINGAIKLIQGIEIVGLKPFAGLKSINVPQIPHLARGTVLPANRPFLAVVGDQRHGTNIEAPLATIQEAVAAVMGDHISAMMAGFEALLQEQQATRRTIENIEIGDTVIGQAADRYNSKMAVICGR